MFAKSFLRQNLLPHKVLLVIGCLIFLFLAGWIIIRIWGQSQYIGVVEIDELHNMQYERKELDGKTAIIRGDAIVEPSSKFRFNGFYLVDSQTPNHLRGPSYGFWFGVLISDYVCKIGKETMTCQPFDPTKATTFEFKGTLHSEQMGKRGAIWLSDIDFDQSRQLINGKWTSIPLGEFEVSIETQ